MVVTELDVELVRMGTEVGGMTSGAGERDGKTVARPWFKVKSCKWMIQGAANRECCIAAPSRNWEYGAVNMTKWVIWRNGLHNIVAEVQCVENQLTRGLVDPNLTEHGAELALEHTEKSNTYDRRDGTGRKRKILCEKHTKSTFWNE